MSQIKTNRTFNLILQRRTRAAQEKNGEKRRDAKKFVEIRRRSAG
jgi:hypothetical protein